MRGIALCRPLLVLRRREIEAFLLENGIDDWRIDSTNSDSHYRRNAVRNELLPLFRRIFGNDAGLLRSMENLSCDADCIEECAAHLELNDIGKWQALHQAVLFRAVRGLLESNFQEVPPLTYNFIQRLQTELAKFKGKPVALPLNENVFFRLERGGLRVVKNAPEWSVQRWNWRDAMNFYLPGWHFSIVEGPGEGTEAFDEALLPSDVRRLHLESYDRKWLDFVVSSRCGKEPWKEYDIIEGGVANDQVIDTVEDYYSCRISAEQAIGQLRYAKPTHQMCISSQRIVDRCLRFITAEPIDAKGGLR